MKMIKRYFPLLTFNQLKQFYQMKLLYKQCNTRINLISHKTIHWFYEYHVLHSLCIAKIVNFLQGALILDAGTGGGFPGIPLAIMFPESNFFLIDSITKKIVAVKEIANTLELNNLTVECTRVENISSSFDFIITRAVASLPNLISFSNGKILATSRYCLQNGILALKGGYLSSEKKNFPQYKEYWIKSSFKEEFFKYKKILFYSCPISTK
ncbi:glucose-inhibited division protein B [Candidatus Uzinura diaspidicola str. ASNER]|uniref:Ribosomal RNA small subunit methyltransferase G n=1 Tax=Candidatus Uzinura diaspidicola str. ASNER TaxID=1133592 RepID=L7VN91_9FLAO|nr:glucose-inhibited division protein B [Candidatus Uzinura diaspidicola str. ASNER]